jgi:hypothetical protein
MDAAMNALPYLNLPPLKRRGFCTGLLGAGAALTTGLPTLQAFGATRPNGWAITVAYSAPAAQRARLQAELQGGGAARLRQWRSEGTIAGFRILFNQFADSDLWDAMLLVEFSDEGPGTRWFAAQNKYPSALDPKVYEALSAVHTTPLELVRRGSVAPTPANPVIMAIPYQVMVSAGDYEAYADGYVIPQLEGWMREGILGAYSLWGARFPAGRQWTHLLLLDYRDEQALGHRDEVVAKVRGQLKSDPRWQAISESKHKIREERQPVIAVDLGSSAT